MSEVLSLWKGVIKTNIEVGPTPRELLMQMVDDIAIKHGVTRAEITGPSRVRHIVRARQEVFYELHQHGVSYPRSGLLIGGRDHTTALYGKRRHQGRLGR